MLTPLKPAKKDPEQFCSCFHCLHTNVTCPSISNTYPGATQFLMSPEIKGHPFISLVFDLFLVEHGLTLGSCLNISQNLATSMKISFTCFRKSALFSFLGLWLSDRLFFTAYPSLLPHSNSFPKCHMVGVVQHIVL